MTDESQLVGGTLQLVGGTLQLVGERYSEHVLLVCVRDTVCVCVILD